MLAQGTQLAQSLASASAATLFSATLRTEITSVLVCNVTGTAATFDLYHDDDGTTFDTSTAIYYQANVPGNSTVSVCSQHEGGGIAIDAGGALGMNSDTDNALNFTVYGVTETIGVAR